MKITINLVNDINPCTALDVAKRSLVYLEKNDHRIEDTPSPIVLSFEPQELSTVTTHKGGDLLITVYPKNQDESN